MFSKAKIVEMREKISSFLGISNKNLFVFILGILSWFLLLLVFISIPIFSISNNVIPAVLSLIFCLFSFTYVLFTSRISINFSIASIVFFLLYSAIITLIGSRDFLDLKSYFTIISLLIVLFEFLICVKKVKLAIILYVFSILVFFLVFCIYYSDKLFLFFKGNSERLGDHFDNVNGVGITFLSGLILTLYLINSFEKIDRKKYRIFAYIIFGFLCLLFSFGIVLTGSKMSFLGILISFLTFIFLNFWKKHKKILLVVLLSFIALIIVAFSLPAFAPLKERLVSMIGSFGNDSFDHSTLGRFSMLMSGLESWTHYLFTGVGANGFSFIAGHVNYSHATISEILCDFGIIGTFLLFFPILWIFVNAKKRKQESFAFFSLFVLGLFFPGLFGTVLLKRKAFFLLLSFGFALDYIVNEETCDTVSFALNFKDKFKIIFESRLDHLKNVFQSTRKFLND